MTFEDDLTTGYFYAVDTKPDLKILDALHIYNVADVIDKDKSCKLQIVWTDNGKVASLLINGYSMQFLILTNKLVIAEMDFQKVMGNGAKQKKKIKRKKGL